MRFGFVIFTRLLSEKQNTEHAEEKNPIFHGCKCEENVGIQKRIEGMKMAEQARGHTAEIAEETNAIFRNTGKHATAEKERIRLQSKNTHCLVIYTFIIE